MPFVELLAPPVSDATREAVVQAITDAVCQTFQSGPETVTIYFRDIPPGSYAHAGVLGTAGPQRVFLKLHASHRPVEAKRLASVMLTSQLARLYGIPEQALAIYFFDRRKDEIAYGGVLASDSNPD
jgi:phenylpyruvate tautomerase PptA (4-oxalocrotonate tautomerase family)